MATYTFSAFSGNRGQVQVPDRDLARMPLAMRCARSSARPLFFFPFPLPSDAVGIHVNFGNQLSHYKNIITIILISLSTF